MKSVDRDRTKGAVPATSKAFAGAGYLKIVKADTADGREDVGNQGMESAGGGWGGEGRVVGRREEKKVGIGRRRGERRIVEDSALGPGEGCI